jgi:hypothetical protein
MLISATWHDYRAIWRKTQECGLTCGRERNYSLEEFTEVIVKVRDDEAGSPVHLSAKVSALLCVELDDENVF